MEKEIKYEAAVRQLEDIVSKLENNELDIDELSTELKKAQQLVKLCKDKLTKTDEEIKKILEKSRKSSEYCQFIIIISNFAVNYK